MCAGSATSRPPTAIRTRSCSRSNEGLSLIEQGPFDGEPAASAAEAQATGIARRLTTPSYASVHYSGPYDAEIAAAELARPGARRIGFVASSALYHSFGEHLRASLAGCEVVDAADLVDRTNAVKSAEERAFMGEVAAMQDAVMAKVARFIRPGRVRCRAARWSRATCSCC